MARHYVHPLPGVKQGRTDQGVDFAPSKGTKIRAIGDAVVAFIGRYQGFGTYVAYRLTSGRLKGTTIFLAEGIDLRVKVGQRLKAGQTVAVATGASMGIEMGFAQGSGTFLPLAKVEGGYTEGQVTAPGKRFARLLTVLGSNPSDVPSSFAPAAPPASAPAPAATLPQVEPAQIPAGPPPPEASQPTAYAPGSVPADGSVSQDPAETWRVIAAQPLASDETRLFMNRLGG